MTLTGISLWLFGIACALVGFLFTWLFYKRADQSAVKNQTPSAINPTVTSTEKDEIETLKADNKRLQRELDLCHARSKLAASAAKKVEAATRITSSFKSTDAVVFDAEAAKKAFGKKVKQDDLKIVEGIGPKIEELFHQKDIKSWRALSETPVEKCKMILTEAGLRYKMHNPGTWPDQAKLAYQGKWTELKTLQDKLSRGK
ncbi:hypothetical protein GCM10009117_17870 [Gangjinia marincola]|uniref:Flap endonuclease-1-like 5' DNA nuclease n=1 Tax=Gangjinia marincola TaxID=578463 RepID=A0ABN1MHL8_9FLAO